MMAPGLRKLALTIHITAAGGWIGGVIAYLCLVIAALASPTPLLQAAWPALEIIAWYGLAPLAILALLTGLVLALGTPWGLFQHYWVLISLVLTTVATIILLTQLPQIRAMAALAAAGETMLTRQGLWGQLLHAGVGLLVLLVIQVLNVYKPRGITPYGWKKQRARSRIPPADETPV
jgi:hypothetical protein